MAKKTFEEGLNWWQDGVDAIKLRMDAESHKEDDERLKTEILALENRAKQLDEENQRKVEETKRLDAEIATRRAAITDYEQKYGKITRLAELDAMIAERTNQLKALNRDKAKLAKELGLELAS